MILALGARGRGFDSRSGPIAKKNLSTYSNLKKLIDSKSIAVRFVGSNPTLAVGLSMQEVKAECLNVDSKIVLRTWFAPF